jgi:hypothetical protein
MFRKLHPPVNPVTVTIDGVAMQAEAGEPVAAILLRGASCHARLHPVSGEPRAPYCMMGACQECLAIVDGVASIQTCRIAARDGMVVLRQQGMRSIPDV